MSQKKLCNSEKRKIASKTTLVNSKENIKSNNALL